MATRWDLTAVGDVNVDLIMVRPEREPAIGQEILVEVVERAQVAEVPVEGCPVALDRFRDRRHDDVAAVAGITSHCEAPSA